MSNAPLHGYMDDAIRAALRQGRTVEIVACEEYGWNVEIDGETILETGGRGLAWEFFNIPTKDVTLTNEGRAVLEEVYNGE